MIVCERRDVLASGCAIPRVFPTFGMKTEVSGNESKATPKAVDHQVQVEFIITDEANGSLSPNDAETLTQSAFGIQLSARIVDTPCNFMHTDGFIAEAMKVGQELGN